jgi:transcription antitermination factor NusG
MLTIAQNPPITWPENLDLAGDDQLLTVAYGKPRQEKALAWDLCRKEIPYFLPMVYRETVSGGRRRRNLYPLFPSYLFFAGGEAARAAALRTDRIVRIVEIDDSQRPQFQQEMASLQIAVQNFPESIKLYPRLVPGARVRVTAGLMKNIEGIIIQSENKKKLWLGVTILGVGATLEIHADLVEAC